MSYRLQQSLADRRCVTRNTPSKPDETSPPFSFSTTIYRYAETDCDFVDRRRRLTAHLEGVRYYGYRFYNPDLGRWINRDPIGESKSMNLCEMLNNDIVNSVDYLGLWGGGGVDWGGGQHGVPQGPTPIDQLHPWFGGGDDGEFVDNSEWFENHYGPEVDKRKKEAQNSINSQICDDDSEPTYSEEWVPEQDFFHMNYVLGRTALVVEDLNITWNELDYTWTAKLVVRDGLGFDGGAKAGTDFERNVQEPYFGWFFTNREIVRAEWPISGSGSCCDDE